MKAPENFMTRGQAALAVGTERNNPHFNKLWARLAGAAFVAHSPDNINSRPCIVSQHGASLYITKENSIHIKTGVIETSGGETEDDVFLAKSETENLANLYFAYAPYTSLAETTLTTRSKKKVVEKREGKKY